MDITDSLIQLQNMYNRKSNTYAEHKIFPYVTTEDLRMDLMDKVRNLAKSKNPDHPWLKMSDEEILKSAGLWEKDFSSGIKGYNLAGVLLFGKDEVIRSCCPGYITDAIYRVENLDRYDDRLQVTTNLIKRDLGNFHFKEGGQNYHSVGEVDEIQVIIQDSGSVKAPEYSHTANRSYAIVQNGKLKHLTFYDETHSQVVSIDLMHQHHGLYLLRHNNHSGDY